MDFKRRDSIYKVKEEVEKTQKLVYSRKVTLKGTGEIKYNVGGEGTKQKGGSVPRVSENSINNHKKSLV